MTKMAGLSPKHFLWDSKDRIATIRLNRPDRKNPLTFESYAELRDTFRALVYAEDIDVVIFASNGGNFCSGGDVHDIIGPLVGMDMKELLAFTRMTGDLVKAMIGCGKPIISAVDGICVGAGAIVAMASDLRVATPEAKCAFLFTRVGLAGCDMGACAMLPRIVGQGRAADLLYTGRTMSADEGHAWGFWNALHAPEALEAEHDIQVKVRRARKFLEDGDKVQIAAGVTADSCAKVKAGELVNFVAQQVGGKGGGKPDMAMAGGTDASGLPKALASVQAWVAERV